MADLRKFFTALAAMHESGPDAIEQLHCALERIPLTVQHLKETPVHLVHSILTPPITDPTRPPRRTGGPRLLVRSVDGVRLHSLPAADSRNLTGRRAQLFVAEWEIWLIDENHQEHMLEHHGTGAGALSALPRLMRQVGLIDEHGARPATEGGVSDAA
ncbi:hypothetical protein [Kocuria oceani]|uniref:Uncharacterized protein n=1 Tax=Kocuria oceani TaxID=988827 RepID=A0ABV9TIJ0_9MICC|nr:hypothetical protein [Kocuria oceani]